MAASLKMKAKVLLRSGSLRFARDYFGKSRAGKRSVYVWNGIPITYRSGTSDLALIYSILLKHGSKSEYSIPQECGLDPQSVGVVLDIGANIGISSLHLARTFPRAIVHAFEPEPANCELLRINVAAEPRVHVHPIALGADDGELTLFDSDDAANFGGFSAHGQGVNPARARTVPVRHAGRALAELGVASVDVIKIDTEGSEWEILTSIDRSVIGGVRLIMGELHGRRVFALLDYLQPQFHVGLRKQIKNRLFNFYALNRKA